MTTPELDFRDPSFRIDPYPVLAELRSRGSVHQDSFGVWLVLRHADVHALIRDPRAGRDLRRWVRYGALRPYLADSALERTIERWMFSLDPPEHTRLRRLAAHAFTPKAVEAMGPAIRAVAEELLSSIGERDDVELMTAFAQPFPIRVIGRILSLPEDDQAKLKAWSDAIALVLEPTPGRKKKMAADAAVVEMDAYLRERIASHRGQDGEDLFSRLVRAEETGDRLDEDELVAQLVMLFIAGHETTANLIGNGMLALLRNPDQLARLRADRGLLGSAVEEMLRYDGPANMNARVAHEDIRIGDHVIPEGQLAFAMLGAANRDPEVFAHPDTFDIGRSPNPHVTFGGGVHSCLGAPLARLEAQIAFDAMLERWPSIALADSDPPRRDLINVRSLANLPVVIHRRG